MGIYYGLGIMLSVLYKLLYLIFIINLWDRYYDYVYLYMWKMRVFEKCMSEYG